MPLDIRKIQVWCGEIPDRPGMAAATLEHLAQAGIHLEFVFTRDTADQSGNSTIFLGPIKEPEHREAAKKAGLRRAANTSMLCVEADNRLNTGFKIMSELAIAGINLRGLSMSSIGGRVVAYLAFDNPDVAQQAIQILAALDI